MRQMYQAVLLFYPREYRATFAAEMLDTFECAAASWRKRGRGAFAGFVARELIGLFGGLFTEWTAKWATGERYITTHCLASPAPGLPLEIAETQKQLQQALSRMQFAIANHDFPGARLYSNEERAIREQLHRLASEYKINLEDTN